MILPTQMQQGSNYKNAMKTENYKDDLNFLSWRQNYDPPIIVESPFGSLLFLFTFFFLRGREEKEGGGGGGFGVGGDGGFI